MKVTNVFDDIAEIPAPAPGPAPGPTFYTIRVKGAEWVELRNFPFNIRLDLYKGRLFGRMRVAERDTGHGIDVTLCEKVPAMPAEFKEADFIQFVRRCVAKMVLHELDECLRAHGKLVVDAHAEETTPKEARGTL